MWEGATLLFPEGRGGLHPHSKVSGYTGAGRCAVCRSPGTAYAVSERPAAGTAATMTGYSVRSASAGTAIASIAPGAVSRAAGYT